MLKFLVVIVIVIVIVINVIVIVIYVTTLLDSNFLWLFCLAPQALEPKCMAYQLDIIFFCIILTIVFSCNMGVHVNDNKFIMAKRYKIHRTAGW